MVKPASDKVISGIQKIGLSAIFKYLPKDEVLVFLFGSQVTQNALGASDVDVGLLCNTTIANNKLSSIKDEINQQARTLRQIDIIDFSALEDETFLKQALGGI